jgi:hypothetical protein
MHLQDESTVAETLDGTHRKILTVTHVKHIDASGPIVLPLILPTFTGEDFSVLQRLETFMSVLKFNISHLVAVNLSRLCILFMLFVTLCAGQDFGRTTPELGQILELLVKATSLTKLVLDGVFACLWP